MLKIKKIKPMFNQLITTMDEYEQDGMTGSIIDPTKKKGTIKEYQTVLAVGSTVRDIKVGDLVCINPVRYAKMKHQEGSLKDGVITDNAVVGFNFNVVQVDDKDCLLLFDSDIRYIIEDFEEIPDPEPSKIIKPSTEIIL